jgi:hypothetical protein
MQNGCIPESGILEVFINKERGAIDEKNTMATSIILSEVILLIVEERGSIK